MDSPAVINKAELTAGTYGKIVVWAGADRLRAIQEPCDCPLVASLDEIAADTNTLVVVGGGRRIDLAKHWRVHNRPDMKLVAIPSLWGSGAEASPVAVIDHDGAKEILIGNQYLPDARCIAPEFIDTLSDEAALFGCGDSWSHALEGFLSPLAGGDMRQEMADIIRDMLKLPLGKHPDWYEASARACNAQARSSVGLVHGIAHTLEAPLRAGQNSERWGHAKLTSLYLYPVMEFNRAKSDRLSTLFDAFDIDADTVFDRISKLYSNGLFDQTLTLLEQAWPSVIRDPCSRTNCVIVRRQSIDFFIGRQFC